VVLDKRIKPCYDDYRLRERLDTTRKGNDMPTHTQTASYTVTMIRPDRKRIKTRYLFAANEAPVRSLRQLAGFLTHLLFADAERGGDGTLYNVKIVTPRGNRSFTVRAEGGKYYLI
jgi:hypothetical protein